jgi:hypothetical protein
MFGGWGKQVIFDISAYMEHLQRRVILVVQKVPLFTQLVEKVGRREKLTFFLLAQVFYDSF